MTARRRTRDGIVALSILAAVVTFLVATKLFPYHSLNHDEGVYLQQAAMLLDGKLFLHPPVPDAFRPWFFVRDASGLYPKYAPVPAAMFALGGALGDARLSLGLVAAGNVALVALVATQAFDRRTGLLAAVLFFASPLFLVDSAVFLPYAPTTFWNLLFAFAYFRSARTKRNSYAVLAGVAVGIAFFSRPYTALLFALPFVAHALYSLRSTWFDRPTVVRLGTVAAVGSLGVVVALGYNAVVTGSPLVFPYEAFAPLDGLGFGHRKLLGYEQRYTVRLALRSNFAVVSDLFVNWVAGGPLGTALALVGVLAGVRWTRPSDWEAEFSQHQARAVLAGLIPSVVLGNVYFWGNRNIVGTISDPGDGLIHFFGPYYHFDLLLPTAAFGAFGAVVAARWLRGRVESSLSPSRAKPAVVALLVLSTVVFGGVTAAVATSPYRANATVTDQYRAAYSPVENRSFDDALVFVPTTYGDWLNHPFQAFRNHPDFDGRVVYALDGPNRFDVVDAYSNRTLYRYVYRGEWAPDGGEPVEPRLQRVREVRGESVSLTTTAGLPRSVESASIRLASDSGSGYYVVEGDRSARFRLVVSDGRARLVGSNVSAVGDGAAVPVNETDTVAVEMYVENAEGTGFSYLLRLPVERRDGSVRALTPYEGICRVARTCDGEGTAYLPNETAPGVSLETRLQGSE
ncbi:hypothetical protein ZOD2009_20188 [Haladaptatus paucihalophilus DX253]|uniref:Dolichyl-phosphate-mannose-protein mannosyltransferase n=1 Tax=Haladaptatus paucihalophilus DX253 TaxID=797209 RepID=E7QYZ7_HALPU|nr:glycosyltransferase family 39 protein [Haladaptatus paucihalophilus]EFW90413.1 hypothetical protein ZOD2009_20188 [Haladaptatus paucihalophilus DX253]SHK03840.1 Dolichyl-phosphate-mannose-protein mannosyltransferase [Haladaptatus paucihalophilus DX253]